MRSFPIFYLSFIFWHFLISSGFSQSKNPIIKASSSLVSIKDGAFFEKNAWSLSPQTKPDVYVCDRARVTKKVVFYTDIDSIETIINPGTFFDFVILLNGKDSCFTRIQSAIPVELKTDKASLLPDTIPFKLSPQNAIQVLALVNNRDSLNLHLDVGSFDFRFTKKAILNKTKLLGNQQDGSTKPNFNQLEKVFSIQLGKINFEHPTVVPTEYTAHQMDGRFGWNLFENKIVEINYDKNILVIHPQLPKLSRAYKKSELVFKKSFVCLSGAIEINKTNYSGEFLIDNGSEQALILDSSWRAKNRFPGQLNTLKTISLKDGKGNAYETRLVQIPAIHLNDFTVSGISALLLGGKNPVGFEVNFIGNEVMKRFNTFLDFKSDHIYLKPNKLMDIASR